jgi:hypothetical protein
MEDVNLSSGGTETLYVKFKNPTKYTAFQFDLTLPKGVGVESASIGGEVPETRKLENACIDEASNKYRFLSYDMKNTNLAENASLKITLKAAADAAEGVAETTEGLVVTSDGTSTDQDVASANVTVGESGITLPIPGGGKLATVLTKDVDFTSLEAQDVKAYIATGYEYDSRKVWLTRVNQVPAGTPIVVIGDANTNPVVPVVAKSLTYYGENLLKGSASEATILDWDSYKYFVISKSDGKIGNLATTTPSIAAEKVCIQVPQDVKIASNPKGSDESITIAEGGRLAYVNAYDLDFSGVDGLKAYTVTGFGQKIMWLTEIKNASAGTPMLLSGEPNKTYDVPSTSAIKSYYANMLRGSATENLEVKAKDGDYQVLVLSKKQGQYGELAADQSAFPKGTSYLPVLASYNVKSAGARGNDNLLVATDSEMLSITIDAFEIDEFGDLTGIRSIENLKSDDAWYNLNGQRIDTPTRKGLYIRNGKKVIVK